MKAFRRSVAIAFVAALLAGCAVKQRAPDEAFVRPARSATVKFEVPSRLTTKIVRSGGITQYDRDQARRRVQKLLDDTKAQSVASIEAALASNGIPGGDDVLIKVFVDETIDTAYGAGATLSVYAYFKDAPAGTPPWNVKVDVLNLVWDTPESTVARLVSKTTDALTSAGIIAPSRK